MKALPRFCRCCVVGVWLSLGAEALDLVLNDLTLGVEVLRKVNFRNHQRTIQTFQSH